MALFLGTAPALFPGQANALVGAQNAHGDLVAAFSPLSRGTLPLYGLIASGQGARTRRTLSTTVDEDCVYCQAAAINSRGDAVVVWMRIPSQTTGPGPYRVMASYRSAGGNLGTPEKISGIAHPWPRAAPLVAIDGAGDVVAAWPESTRWAYSFKPAGQPWDVPRQIDDEPAKLAMTGNGEAAMYTRAGLYRSVRFGPFEPVPKGLPTASLSDDYSLTARGIQTTSFRHAGRTMLDQRRLGATIGVRIPLSGVAPATQLSVFDTGALAALEYSPSETESRRLYAIRRVPHGPIERSPALASFPPRTLPYPLIASNATGDVAVAWRLLNGEVRLRYWPAGEPPGKTLVGYNAPVVASFQQPEDMTLGITTQGVAQVVWEHSDGERVQEDAVRFSRRGLGRSRTLFGSPTYTPSPHQGACYSAGHDILLKTPASVIYLGRADIFGSVTWGCYFARGIPIPLNRFSEVNTVTPVASAGPLAAYATVSCGEDTGCGTAVGVEDLRANNRQGLDRRILVGLGADNSYGVGAIVVNRVGALGFTRCDVENQGVDSSLSCPRRALSGRVSVIDSRSDTEHAVDRGPAVDLRSLRIVGSRISWLHGRSLRHARLR